MAVLATKIVIPLIFICLFASAFCFYNRDDCVCKFCSEEGRTCYVVYVWFPSLFGTKSNAKKNRSRNGDIEATHMSIGS